MGANYRVLWYGNGGVGVVSKEYTNCVSRDDALDQFVADQGEHAKQRLIEAYKMEESDKTSCAGCLHLANEIRQLRNEVSDLRSAANSYLDTLGEINELSSVAAFRRCDGGGIALDAVGPGIATYSIGPFHFDENAKTITISPGVYTVRVPIVLPYNNSTVTEGVHYTPLEDQPCNQ